MNKVVKDLAIVIAVGSFLFFLMMIVLRGVESLGIQPVDEPFWPTSKNNLIQNPQQEITIGANYSESRINPESTDSFPWELYKVLDGSFEFEMPKGAKVIDDEKVKGRKVTNSYGTFTVFSYPLPSDVVLEDFKNKEYRDAFAVGFIKAYLEDGLKIVHNTSSIKDSTNYVEYYFLLQNDYEQIKIRVLLSQTSIHLLSISLASQQQTFNDNIDSRFFDSLVIHKL